MRHLLTRRDKVVAAKSYVNQPNPPFSAYILFKCLREEETHCARASDITTHDIPCDPPSPASLSLFSPELSVTLVLQFYGE